MFWNVFAKLCVDAGKSPNTVAAECGVKSSGTVTGWKNGAVPRPAVLQRIAEYFDTEVETFELPDVYVPPEKHKKAAPATEDGLQSLTDDERALLLHYRTMAETDRDMMRDLARRLKHGD